MDRGGRDLDNYLYPLVRRVGADRIAAAFARKLHQPGSTIAAGSATPIFEPSASPQLTVRTSVSTRVTAWWCCRDGSGQRLRAAAGAGNGRAGFMAAISAGYAMSQ